MTHLLTGYLNTILGNSSGAEAKPQLNQIGIVSISNSVEVKGLLKYL